jgi:hypothetical protein
MYGFGQTPKPPSYGIYTMKNSIVWMASYPKSGNTWARIFLSNYLVNAEKPIPINKAHLLVMGDSNIKTYHMVAGQQINVNDIEKTLSFRDKVLRGIIANKADVNLVKTHNIRKLVRGVNMIPDEYTKSAVYILRNPLDMVLSYARHYGLKIKDAVACISNPDNANAPTEDTVAQFLGTWSDHVNSWTSGAHYPVLVLKYEDLLADPKLHFAKLVAHFGLPLDEERLERAIRFSSIKELRKQEKESGFVERSQLTDKFFGKGTSGQWESQLSDDLVKYIRREHRDVMERYGYYT